MNYDKVITYAFYILLTITAVLTIINENNEKLFRVALNYATIFITGLLFKKSFLKRSKSAYVMALAFIFFSLYLGSVLNFYGLPYYDKILHLVSGVLLAFYGLLIYIFLFGNKENTTIKPIAMVVFSLLFAMACAGAWEIWEFTTDYLFNLNAQNNSLNDTMWDIISGTVGGGFSCFLMYLYIKGRKARIVRMIIKDMEE